MRTGSRPAMDAGAGRAGTTLLELLIVTSIFSFLALATFVLFHHGSAFWLAVQQRSAMQGQLQRFQREISAELRRTSRSSIFLWGYSPNDSYKRGICCKSAMNDVRDPTRLGDPIAFQVDDHQNPPVPAWQRWVLFYVTRMDQGQHLDTYGYVCASYSGDQKVADNVCPHKWLVRKDIYLTYKNKPTIEKRADLVDPARNGTVGLPFIEGSKDGIGSEPTTAGLSTQQEGQAPGSLVRRARVVATDVLTFNFAVKTPMGGDTGIDSLGHILGNTVAFDVRALKMVEAQASSTGPANIGIADMSRSVYTLQLDNRVTPENP